MAPVCAAPGADGWRRKATTRVPLRSPGGQRESWESWPIQRARCYCLALANRVCYCGQRHAMPQRLWALVSNLVMAERRNLSVASSRGWCSQTILFLSLKGIRFGQTGMRHRHCAARQGPGHLCRMRVRQICAERRLNSCEVGRERERDKGQLSFVPVLRPAPLTAPAEEECRRNGCI